jgi:hypothetical protein
MHIGIENKVKEIVSYSKSNGIIAFKKHVDANHGLIVKKVEEINNLKGPREDNIQEKV